MGPRPLHASIAPLALAWLAVGGCAALPLLAPHLPKADQTTISPAGEDGTRYIAVEGGPLSSPRTMQARWNGTARRVCQGDYQKISDSGATRRSNGVTSSRIHEGFIQCLLPDGSEPGDDGPTMTDATRAPNKGARRRSSPRLGQR